MGHRFMELAFTDAVKAMQRRQGSRDAYAAMEQGDDVNHRLGEQEMAFIAARDSFYMASVGAGGWPYVQHRGGPAGFVRVLDEGTLGFADFRGNRQYVSVGNLADDARVALFFMDYPNQVRLKLLARARVIGAGEDTLLARLEVDDYRARVERGVVIEVEGFDWNCPQHITPRYTLAEFEAMGLSTAGLAREAAGSDDVGEAVLDLVVSGMRQLTGRVRGYELRAADGGTLPLFEAGAHLRLPVPLADGRSVIRQYSICSDPARRGAWEIAVLREEPGRGGSRALHDGFRLGLRLRVPPPENRFALHDDARPALLIAGGIGITPLRAMAATLAAAGRDFHLHYAGRSETDMAFRDDLLREHPGRVSLHVSSAGTRLDPEALLAAASADALVYLCGPARLIDGVLAAADRLGIARERLRFERFEALAIADPQPLEVVLNQSGRRVQVPAGTSILEAVEAAGIEAPYNCRVGTCRTCAVRVLDGEPLHADSALSAQEHGAGGLMCICVSRALTPTLTLDL